MLVQSSMPLLHPVSMPFQDRNDKGRLRWKVMMDTCLADMDSFGNVGITERRVSAIGDQRVGRLKDAICGFSLHAYETTD